MGYHSIAVTLTTSQDGSMYPMMPNEARLRNLTYWGSLYVDVTKRIRRPDELEEEEEEVRNLCVDVWRHVDMLSGADLSCVHGPSTDHVTLSVLCTGWLPRPRSDLLARMPS